MSAPRNSKLERVLGALLLATLVIAALFVGAAPNKADDTIGSVASFEPKGRRAAFVLLTELGFRPEIWKDAPGELPAGGDVLWLAKTPTHAMPGLQVRAHPSGEKSTDDHDVERVGLHALEHYQRFVLEGGTLVMSASEENLEFLSAELEFEDTSSLELDDTVRESIRPVRTLAGETLDAGVRDAGLFRALDPNGAARVWMSVTEGASERPFVVSLPAGAGSIVLLSDDHFVENDAIGAHDHAAILVRLAEELARGNRLLFDDYELGGWRPTSTLALVLSPKFVLASLHLAMLLALFVWMHAFARAFPRDPEPLESFAPLQRARAIAGLVSGVGRTELLASMLRRGSFGRMSALARMRGLAAPRSEPSSAERAPAASEIERLGAVPALIELAPRFHRVFSNRKISTIAALDELDLYLRELERAVEERLLTRTRERRR